MKTILYIYGYLGSHNGNTVNLIKENLDDRVNLISFEYPQEDPNKSIDFLNTIIETHKPDLVVGTSLGGYWAIQLKNVKRIIINPCVHPEVELEHLKNPDCPPEVYNKYKEYIDKNPIWDGWSDKEKFNTTVIFGTHDELLGDKYWEETISHSRNVAFSDQGHSNNKDSIKNTLVPMIYNSLFGKFENYEI